MANATTAPTLPSLDRAPVFFISAAFAAIAVAISAAVSPRQALLFVIGGLLGVTLYHASFGFTGGWRRMVVERRGRAMRVQMLMIGLTAIAFIPLLAQGSANGLALAGAFAPVGVSVLVGALMFGLGMQLGGGCGSGTLFTVGGGSARMLVTLIFFIVGAALGTAHLPWWLAQPSMPQVSLGQVLGVPLAIAITLAGLVAVAAVTAFVEKKAHGSLEAVKAPNEPFAERLIRGPWSLVAAALLLAGLNVATLLTAGHPWSVTFGFGLWGLRSPRRSASPSRHGPSGTGRGRHRRSAPAFSPTTPQS